MAMKKFCLKKKAETTQEKPKENKKHRIRVVKFSISDIAEAKGVTNSAIHKAVNRKIVQPRNLVSLAKYILREKGNSICKLCGHDLQSK